MMEKAIVARGLRKSFGPVAAVDGISFEVDRGEIFGFLGPNGAGKTTTVRIVNGILKPDAGTVKVLGLDVLQDPSRAKECMGVLPELANAYVDLSSWQNLMIMGKIYGVEKEARESRAEDLLRRLSLLERKDDRVRNFSRGMKQKLLFAMATISDPLILFLDEPTSGLDVQSARLIRQMIKEENEAGKTIFLTTHNMDEASQFCHRIAIIHRGKLVAIDMPNELRRTMEKAQIVEVRFARKPEHLEVLERLSGVGRIQLSGELIRLFTEDPDRTIRELVKYANSTGMKFLSLNTTQATLEDVFVELTK